VRIDVITAIDGVDFADARRERVTARLGGAEVAVLSRRLLIVNKRKAGRAQDLADLAWLERGDSEHPPGGR
jgi:hypothetical protein